MGHRVPGCVGAVTPAHTRGRWQGGGVAAKVHGCAAAQTSGAVGAQASGCAAAPCPVTRGHCGWLGARSLPSQSRGCTCCSGARSRGPRLTRMPGPGCSGPRSRGSRRFAGPVPAALCPAAQGPRGAPRARASPPPLPLPLKGPQRPAGRTLGSRTLPPAPSPPRAVGPPAGHPRSPPRPALVRSAGRGGAAAPPPTRGAGGSGAGSAARGEISGAERPGGVGWRLPPAGTPAPAWNVLASRRRAAPAPGPGPGRGRGGEVTRALPAAGER